MNVPRLQTQYCSLVRRVAGVTSDSSKTMKLGPTGFDRRGKKKRKRKEDMVEIKKTKNKQNKKRLVILCQTFKNDSEATVFCLFVFHTKDSNERLKLHSRVFKRLQNSFFFFVFIFTRWSRKNEQLTPEIEEKILISLEYPSF